MHFFSRFTKVCWQTLFLINSASRVRAEKIRKQQHWNAAKEVSLKLHIIDMGVLYAYLSSFISTLGDDDDDEVVCLILSSFCEHTPDANTTIASPCQKKIAVFWESGTNYIYWYVVIFFDVDSHFAVSFDHIERAIRSATPSSSPSSSSLLSSSSHKLQVSCFFFIVAQLDSSV